jgi:diacylglycerol kinase (ATP)
LNAPQQVLLIYNPAARSAAEPDAWLGVVLHRMNEAWDCVVTVRATKPGLSGSDLLASSQVPPDLVVVAGGDGTIQSVVGALAESHCDTPVAISPAGTGNQCARNLGVFQENLLYDPLERALQILLHGTPTKIDLGRMNGHYFTVAAGAGPISDAVITPGREDKTNWKMLAYASSMIQTFALPPVVFSVTADGDTFQITAAGIFATNVSDLGIGPLSETADLMDGLLDLCILNPTSFGDYVELGFRFGGGFVGGEAPYYIRKIKRVSIEVVPVQSPLSKLQKLRHTVKAWFLGKTELPAPVHREVTAMIDGDACGTTPMLIEVVPQAVTLLMPSGAE